MRISNKYLFAFCTLHFTLCTLIANGVNIQGRPVILEISTTSDWTEVNLENVDFYYLKDTLLSKDGEAWLEILAIRKKSYDSSFTKAHFQIFLLDLPPSIKVSIKKGDIGYTKIRFLSKNSESLAEFVNDGDKIDDPTNQKDFSLSWVVFKKITKEEYTLTLKSPNHKMILAFYYPWYGDNWFRDTVSIVPHKPNLGFYSSSDEKIIRTHIDMAKSAGIDGFVVSWWGRNSPTDQNLLKIQRICEEVGFKFTVYLEVAKTAQDLREEIRYIDSVYSKSPAFIRYQEKPVVFIFARILESLSLDSLRSVFYSSRFSAINYGYSPRNLEGFAGFHEYLPPADNLSMIRQKNLLASQIAYSKKKLYAATVMPGFDDRKINKPGTYIDRKQGEYYKRLWKVVLESNPDWVLITSFNEWFEGTEIEPSEEYGDFYLNLTRDYAALFKQKSR